MTVLVLFHKYATFL